MDLDREVQAARIDELAHEDPELAAIVADLLEVDAASQGEELLQAPSREQKTVGRYTLRHRVATGRVGSVWAGARSDGAFEQEVAVKLIDIEAIARDLGCSLAEARGHERRLLARIDSPYVVRMIDAGDLDSWGEWIALEWLNAESIKDHCHRRSLGIEARARLVVDVCRGVEACHESGVLHLDIAPANVLVTEGGSVKLLDFGSSVAVGGSIGSRLPLTPAYAAPERFQSPPPIPSAKADVAALGALLYELVVGVPPVEIHDVPMAEARRRKLSEDPLPFHRALEESGDEVAQRRGLTRRAMQRMLKSSGLEAVTLAALRRELSLRTPTVKDLREDLERWLRGEPVRARHETLTQRATRLARRRPRAAAAAAAIAVAAFLGGAALFVSARRAERASVEIARLERIEADRLTLARSTAETILQRLYSSISPLAGMQDEVSTLLDVGIEVAESVDDDELSMWLGDAQIKRALLNLEAPDWSEELRVACVEDCRQGEERARKVWSRDPRSFQAVKIGWTGGMVRSVCDFKSCDVAASRAALADAKAAIAAYQPTPEDRANRPWLQTELDLKLVRTESAEITYEVTYGNLERVRNSSSSLVANLEEYAGTKAPLGSGMLALLHETRLQERYLTYLHRATEEELLSAPTGALSPELEGLLTEAEAAVEQLMALVSQEPTKELLISHMGNAVDTLDTWLRQVGRPDEAQSWVERALAMARAPGFDRRHTALVMIAQLEASAAKTDALPMLRDSELGGEEAAGIYLRYASSALERGDPLEAARLAARASSLFEKVADGCLGTASRQSTLASLDAVQGRVEMQEALSRAGDESLKHWRRAKGFLAAALTRQEGITGDALYRKWSARDRRDLRTDLAQCREALGE